MDRKTLIEILHSFSFSDYENLFNQYSNWLIKDKVEPSTKFLDTYGSLSAFVFRFNETISFNDIIRNNDLLVLMKVIDNERGIKDNFFDVTSDPCGKKFRIAHLCEQIYRGNVGFHRGDSNRPCIRSDNGFGTWYNRTDTESDIIDINPSDNYTSIAGHIGINIHNNNGAYNSSLGCVILSSENDYRKIFVPFITQNVTNRNNIPVCVINGEDWEDIRK